MPPPRALQSHRPSPPPSSATASSMDDLLAAADAADGMQTAPLSPTPKPAPNAAGAGEAIVAAPQAAAQAATPRAATAGNQFATVLGQVRALAAEGLPSAALTPEPDPTASVAGSDTSIVSQTSHSQPESGGGGAINVDLRQEPGGKSEEAATGAVLRGALADLGVPAELLTGFPLTLTSVLDQIPPAPPPVRRAGEILAVVGPSTDLLAIEALLVDRLRLTPPDVVHVGLGLRVDPALAGTDRPTRITTIHALSAWRARAPMARHPWLVVIPVDGNAEARENAGEMLYTTRPTQAWGVVDARLKTDDVQRWIHDVGFRREIDALAVRSLMDTSAPGTVLGLGLPVAWLDGLPTSRVVWAAVLGQPLDAALPRS